MKIQEKYNGFESSDDFLIDCVDKWSDADCAQFIRDLSKNLLRPMLAERLCLDFSDCQSVLDLEGTGGIQIDYIKSPSKAKKLGSIK